MLWFNEMANFDINGAINDSQFRHSGMVEYDGNHGLRWSLDFITNSFVYENILPAYRQILVVFRLFTICANAYNST